MRNNLSFDRILKLIWVIRKEARFLKFSKFIYEYFNTINKAQKYGIKYKYGNIVSTTTIV